MLLHFCIAKLKVLNIKRIYGVNESAALNAYVPGLMSFQGKINQNNNNKIALPANKCMPLILQRMCISNIDYSVVGGDFIYNCSKACCDWLTGLYCT